ncbi:MAG TPA: SURF1 family protein [Thermohalobaculum sp.]|nr:SURF1 family protein [Thermohalobaculum sp.]
MRLGVAAAVVFGLAGTSVLAALGVWQLQRLEWKQALIATLEARLAATPVAVPADPDRQRDAFLRVRAEGKIGANALHVLTSLKPLGPGFRVIAPLALADGRRVLADLGYVPEAEKNTRLRPASGAVVGALYWPDETDGFTPAPDRAANIWFARDLEAMAAALEAEPLMIVAETHPLGDWPKPLRLGINLPNDHLQYALTWFSLAVIWAVMSTMLVRRERRRLGG